MDLDTVKLPNDYRVIYDNVDYKAVLDAMKTEGARQVTFRFPDPMPSTTSPQQKPELQLRVLAHDDGSYSLVHNYHCPTTFLSTVSQRLHRTVEQTKFGNECAVQGLSGEEIKKIMHKIENMVTVRTHYNYFEPWTLQDTLATLPQGEVLRVGYDDNKTKARITRLDADHFKVDVSLHGAQHKLGEKLRHHFGCGPDDEQYWKKELSCMDSARTGRVLEIVGEIVARKLGTPTLEEDETPDTQVRSSILGDKLSPPPHISTLILN